MANFLTRLFRRRDQRDAPATSTRSYELNEVFTPSQPAKEAFVPRTIQERDLRSALRAPGTQALIWGESGAGKSSVALKALQAANRKHIATRCDGTSTYESILLSAFAKSKATMDDRSTVHDSAKLSASTTAGSPVIPLSATASAEMESGRARDSVPVAGTQITAEFLAAELGRQEMVWVIEDFHKVSDATRSALADALKVFSDESVNYPLTTVLVLGASDSPAAILETPSNMRGRLATIQLPPLSDDELNSVLLTGGKLLNVDFSAVNDQIIRHSVGVASITHALAFEVCNALNVERTSSATVRVTQESLEEAKGTYVRTRTGSMKADFDRALEVKKTRTYHNHAIILNALAALAEGGATHADILAKIRQTFPEYPSGNLTTYLRKLQGDDRGSLVRKTAEGLFRYNEPLQHAYAMLRFNIEPDRDTSFWADDINVSVPEREEAVRLTNEVNTSAPNTADD